MREQLATKFLRFRRQSTALMVAEPQTAIGNLLSKNPIFFHQIFDHVLLMLVHPSGQGRNQERERIYCPSHPGILPRWEVNDFNGIELLNTTGCSLITGNVEITSPLSTHCNC